jgi:hypothetical protein
VPPSVGFTEDELVVTVKDGRKIATPLSHPSLNKQQTNADGDSLA